MKIVMPMAGHGERLRSLGTGLPKPLIPVADQPMLAWAMEGLREIPCTRFIAIVLKSDDEQFAIGAAVRSWWHTDQIDIVTLDEPTRGQLSTVLAARTSLGHDDLLIASADTLVEGPLAQALEGARCDGRDGLLSVIPMPGDRWSFVRTDQDDRVLEVAEKRRIADLASTGLYWFASAPRFVQHARDHVAQLDHQEHFVMPLYQRYLDTGLRLGITKATLMLDMGTPQSLRATAAQLGGRTANPIPGSRRATR